MILCLVGVIFIVAMIMISFNHRIQKESQEFIDSLDNEQLRKYENIKASRWNIFVRSTVGGIISGLLSVYLYLKTSSPKSYIAGCIFVGVGFLVQYFWYILTPKHEWMVTILNTKKQRDEWNDIYREFQRTYHVGLLLGMAGYFVLGAGMCDFCN